MASIVILGSGFAACTAIKTLRKNGCKDSITVVSPSPELFYFPSLIWVPAGKRQREDLAVNLENFFRRMQVEYRQGSVVGMDPEAKTVKTDAGELGYDALIIASGGRYIRKLEGIDNAHVACAGWEPTKAFADKLGQMDGGTIAFGFGGNPKEPSAMRGGPVFEFLFGTDTLLRKQGRRDRFTLKFFAPAKRPGQRLGEAAVDKLLGEMKRRGVETHLGHKPTRIEADKVVTEGESFDADLVLFIPGMTGPAWASESGLPLSDGGFIQGDEHAMVPGVEDVYVAGDAGSFPGPDWKPKQAHMADLQAEAAVKNLLAKQSGQAQSHVFKTELICIVDALNSASMVMRSDKRNFMFGLPPLHWAKVGFEWVYLKGYR